ncbi:MAG: TetR/AcrR family transcriptional regulator [Paludibacteraceae bacterium]|nr:TetR/AcrR family transcriptional regulator [Paludibacteraceae bacterium]
MSVDAKQRIIEGALKLFIKNGIKSITMDEIAESLSVSKRTIYEHFKDKKNLVFECVQLMDNYSDEKCKEFCESSENIVIYMMKNALFMQQNLKNVNVKFLEELQTLDIPSDYIKQKQMERQVKWEMRLAKGQKEGFIRPEMSPAIISTTFHEAIKFMVEKSRTDHPDASFYDLTRMFVGIMFRGIVTLKGLQVIEEYEKTNPTIFAQ